jgi:hypothetical protein
MAERYWATFRIKNETRRTGTHSQRWQALVNAIRYQSWSVWQEPTSFLAFITERDIDTIALQMKAAIDPVVDVALLRMTEYNQVRLIGTLEFPVEFLANFPTATYV